MPRSGLLHFVCRTRDVHQRPQLPASRLIPDERLLVETDAPYLSPHPWRGREHRNEPARVAIIAARLAELRQSSVEEVGHPSGKISETV